MRWLAYIIRMRLLGLDVSDKRIGVAMTDPLGWTIAPVTTIDRRRLEQDLDDVIGYVQDYGVTTIVVGLPLRGVEGTVDTQARKILTFCEQLRAYCSACGAHADIVTWDESMTTHDARAHLRAMKAKKKTRKSAVDQLSAVFLLQSFLAAQAEAHAQERDT